jgi:hypothetical protein
VFIVGLSSWQCWTLWLYNSPNLLIFADELITRTLFDGVCQTLLELSTQRVIVNELGGTWKAVCKKCSKVPSESFPGWVEESKQKKHLALYAAGHDTVAK